MSRVASSQWHRPGLPSTLPLSWLSRSKIRRFANFAPFSQLRFNPNKDTLRISRKCEVLENGSAKEHRSQGEKGAANESRAKPVLLNHLISRCLQWTGS